LLWVGVGVVVYGGVLLVLGVRVHELMGRGAR
jgi:hypothetical protein